MQLLSRVFTSLLVAIFGLFITSPIFATPINREEIVIFGGDLSSTCAGAIQCEKISEGEYVCHTTPDTLSTQGGALRHLPTTQGPTDTISLGYSIGYIFSEYSREKKITYVGPDTYIYPFVGISKIQV